jgi:hypothetical protein
MRHEPAGRRLLSIADRRMCIKKAGLRIYSTCKPALEISRDSGSQRKAATRRERYPATIPFGCYGLLHNDSNLAEYSPTRKKSTSLQSLFNPRTDRS